METVKITKNLEFEVVYSNGVRRDVQEGVLFEFNGDRITAHVGTDRKACLFAVAEALTELIHGMGLGEEFERYIMESETLDLLS